MSDPRTIEYRPLSEVKVDPRNPKEHDLDVIDASVSRFGYVEPQVIDGRTGRLISGHGRAKALSVMAERGEDPPEGIKVDPEMGWLVPVVVGWSSRTDTEASAALIAMNRATELGGWADESLLDLLDDLSGLEDGYEGIGFTEDDREALTALLDRVEETDRDLDALAEEFGEPTEEDQLMRVVLRLPKDVAGELSERIGDDPAEHLSFAKQVLSDD